MQVGGVDQLLELVETGVGITEHKTRSYPLAIYYGEDDRPEVGIKCVHISVDNTDVHVTKQWTTRNSEQHVTNTEVAPAFLGGEQQSVYIGVAMQINM